MRSRITLMIAAMAAVASMAGCGFIGARNASHGKPNGFLLYGHASVALPAGDQSPAGSPCVAGGNAVDVARDVRVTVLDPAGHKIALGALDPGVVARDGANATCNFSFSIPAVPGGVDSYSIQVGTRTPQQFAASALRQNTPAVITIAP